MQGNLLEICEISMRYSIIITKNTERHIDNILNYLCSTFDNRQVERGLLFEIEHVYNNLEEMPEMYPYIAANPKP